MDRALGQVRAAQSSSDAAGIVKIARELADEILAAREAPWRVTAVVVGLYRKAEALRPEVLTAEDAGRIGRLYLLLSESYADVASRYLERAVRESGAHEDRVAFGNALLYVGDAASARREYLKVSERRQDDPVLQVNLALAERALGDTASAFGRLRQVVMKTTSPLVERASSLALADIQAASNDLSGAQLQALKIIRKWPEDVEALRMLKRIYERQGHADLAKSVDRQIESITGKGGKDIRQTRKGDQK